MELTYTNNKLTIDEGYEKISDASTMIKLRSDLDNVVFFGILTLTNGLTKTIQFVKKNNFYLAKLIIQDHELTVLIGSTFKLKIMSASFDMTSNTVRPVFDVPSINLTVMKYHDYETAELHKEITELRAAFSSLLKGNSLGIEVKGNKDYIKAGMVPIALDNGEFIAAFPFQDMVKKINGIEAVDNQINIDAEDIPYKDVTVGQYLYDINDLQQQLYSVIKTISDQLSMLRQRVDKLDFEFEQYKNKGTL